jgi:hypothetical protein
VKGTSPGQMPDRRPVVLLSVGFTLSALMVYATLSLVGARVIGHARIGAGIWLLAAALLAVLLVVDTGAFGLRAPSWRRQTPKRLLYQLGSSRSAFMWGLDAGLVVTTFRVTSLSWAALTVTVLGLVPWWVGIAYALGFTVPLGVMMLAVPRRVDPTGATDPEPVWLVDRILRFRAALGLSNLLMLGGACATCLTAAELSVR